MMPAIICGHARSKDSGSPPFDIQLSKRCFFSLASSSRARLRRSSSFRRAKFSSQIRLFSAFSLSHLNCASISTSFSASFGNSAIYLCGLVPHIYGISSSTRYMSLHLVLLGWVRLGGYGRAGIPTRGRVPDVHRPPCPSLLRSLRLCLVLRIRSWSDVSGDAGTGAGTEERGVPRAGATCVAKFQRSPTRHHFALYV